MTSDELPDQRAPAEAAPPLAAVAAKAEDLQALQKSIEDTAAVGGGLWLSYLFVLFYLGIAASAVTHVDLFLQNPVKLPFLNIELPLLAFFFLAPLLFVITHAYTLVNLALLADRVNQFHSELRDQLADPGLTARASKIRAALARQLPSNIFVQFLGGPDEIRTGAFGWLLAAILWVTLVVAPIALLLLLQIQFLPYHSRWITWTTRVGLILDLGLLWWLWRNILRRRANRASARRWRTQIAIATAFSVSIILFAGAVATIPGEWGKTIPGKWEIPKTLVLPEFNLYEALKIEDPQKVAWKQYLIDLRDRDLRGALLDRAILKKADLRSAQLQGASLYGAQLQGASLFRAQLQGASLDGAQLQGASLFRAQLQGASLDKAELQGASLESAELQGASLDKAELQSASLNYAQLQGASLDGAQLQGASLDKAELQGASLDFAQLQGASLEKAKLQGASLTGAFLWRAQLNDSVVENIVAPVKNIVAPAGQLQNRAPEYGVSFAAKPEAWTGASYAALRQSIEQSVPQGDMRNAALLRVAILDCARKGDTLASCDASTEPPDRVKKWQKMIEDASVDQATYAKALAAILGDLVCSNEPDEIEVLRGLLGSDRFSQTGNEMPALAKRITTSAECPVSAALTEGDKRALAATSEVAVASAKSR
jgi:uncharacterized protein YjbI with pentapeptide repeats